MKISLKKKNTITTTTKLGTLVFFEETGLSLIICTCIFKIKYKSEFKRNSDKIALQQTHTFSSLLNCIIC